MAQTINLSVDTEKRLAQQIASFRYDAYGFVMFNYPWGVPGSPLERRPEGPNWWQKELLIDVSKHRLENAYRKQLDLDYLVWRSAVASGHGVGKSAEVAWLIDWLMSTSLDTRGVVTANTAGQLDTKTWPELAKWRGMAMNKHWFNWTSTGLYFAKYPEDRRKNYMVNAVTVAEENAEAFQGLHNETGVVFVIFDEASGIFPKLWEIVDGALTDGEPFFFCFGNPTRPDGDFADAFTKHTKSYNFLRQVDSRTIPHTNKAALQDIIDKWGADSDEARVRVYGQFPIGSLDGFILPSLVDDAMTREVWHDEGAPLIMAVDVSRFGDDETVIGWRQGKNTRMLPWHTFHKLDAVQIAERCATLINMHKPSVTVIESVGPGVGVIDILRSKGYRKVQEFHPGAKATKDSNYTNVRAEMWAKLRDWLSNGGALHQDAQLRNQLISIRYGFDTRGEQKLYIEAKGDMKSRGLPSPDRADTLMLTMVPTVPRRDGAGRSRSNTAITEYEDRPGVTA